MDDYIAKPIDSERLMSTIEKWIGRAVAKNLDTPAEKQVQKPIDIDGAMERLGGDAEFLREVVEEFLALAPKQLETVLSQS